MASCFSLASILSARLIHSRLAGNNEIGGAKDGLAALVEKFEIGGVRIGRRSVLLPKHITTNRDRALCVRNQKRQAVVVVSGRFYDFDILGELLIPCHTRAAIPDAPVLQRLGLG